MDFGGLPRVVDDPASSNWGVPLFGATPDMGAHEYQPPACDGDVNGDGVVNVPDLLLVLFNWGSSCP